MELLAKVFRFAALRLLAAIAWSLLLTVLLLQPEADPIIELGLPRGDNTLLRELAFSTLHLLAFSGTCACWHWALPQQWRPRAALFVACAITLVLGVATEFMQTFTLDRHASWLDLVANIGGALIAARLIWTRHIWR